MPNETLPGFLAGQPYVNYESESGRLIRPCKCKGSSRYVHEQCLQQWRHSDRSYTSARHYWQCPTCGFRYRLQRLTWAKYISSAGMICKKSSQNPCNHRLIVRYSSLTNYSNTGPLLCSSFCFRLYWRLYHQFIPRSSRPYCVCDGCI